MTGSTDDAPTGDDAGRPSGGERPPRIQMQRAAELARAGVPAAVVGVASALLLTALSLAADDVQHVLWTTLPQTFDIAGENRMWIFAVLAGVGVISGVVIAKVPGHAGPDPATQSLVSPPLPIWVLPGLAIVVVLGLGGGVSLGPENPIIAINVGLAVWAGRHFTRAGPPATWVGYAVAGTVGSLFSTPVAAALILTESETPDGAAMTWDRMFAPLVAAGTGSITMTLLAQPKFAVSVPDYHGPHWSDLVSAPAIAVVGGLVGSVMIVAFPHMHALFARLPVVWRLSAGGVVLGLLGAAGGSVTLFKGLDEMQDLVHLDKANAWLMLIIVVKVAAVLVAATSGFRGGKIFPATFVGVAIGVLAHQVVPGVPEALAIAAAILGVLLAVSRSGWLSLFMAVVVVGDVALLPVLCLALLPAWLVVTDRADMELPPQQAAGPGFASGTS
ncbi:MAG TPA: ion channel protein [Acidimicrobiales bacterium]|nr:ion channel protein [Acidimicrobiales bacterium]